MKKVGELMKEMGFNPKASDATKEAFLKHLIKQSTGIQTQTPTEKRIVLENPEKIIPFPHQQLSFDFNELNKKKEIKTN